MKINHIGYAVKRMDRAMKAFEQLGFSFDAIIEDIERNVKLVFGMKDGYRIELVCPLDEKKDSPIDQYLNNFFGTPYHICYESRNFEEDIEELKTLGYKVIIEPSPAVAFHNKRVVFMVNSGFGLMEIAEI